MRAKRDRLLQHTDTVVSLDTLNGAAFAQCFQWVACTIAASGCSGGIDETDTLPEFPAEVSIQFLDIPGEGDHISGADPLAEEYFEWPGKARAAARPISRIWPECRRSVLWQSHQHRPVPLRSSVLPRRPL